MSISISIAENSKLKIVAPNTAGYKILVNTTHLWNTTATGLKSVVLDNSYFTTTLLGAINTTKFAQEFGEWLDANNLTDAQVSWYDAADNTFLKNGLVYNLVEDYTIRNITGCVNLAADGTFTIDCYIEFNTFLVNAGDWATANAVIFVHAWEGTFDNPVNPQDYKVVNGKFTCSRLTAGLCMVRMPPGSEAVDWNTRWNQSYNLPMSTGVLTFTGQWDVGDYHNSVFEWVN